MLMDTQNYMILDTLLFKLVHEKIGDEIKLLLWIPILKIDMLLDYYHTLVSGCHTGITKCYLTISDRFYCPNLAHHMRAYITGCHVCQLLKGRKFDHQFHKWVNINTPALTKVSMDIKDMPSTKAEDNSQWKYMLVLLCETSNFVVLSPLKMCTAIEVCKVIKHNFIDHYGPPECITCDQDPAFMSKLTTYSVQQFGFKLYTVGVTNHKSLLAEHGIKSLSNLLKNIMWQTGGSWIHYLDEVMLTYNSFSTPNLDGLSPFELVYGCQAKIIPDLELTPKVPIAVTYHEYMEKLRKQLTFLCKHIQKFKEARTEMINKDKTAHGFMVGQLVYLYLPSGVVLTGSRKISCKFIGSLVIYKEVSPNQFLLMSLLGEVYPRLIEETRMKPATIRTSMGNVTTLADLKKVLRQNIC